MSLKEQFEKETGEGWTVIDHNNMVQTNDSYVEWLEQRQKKINDRDNEIRDYFFRYANRKAPKRLGKLFYELHEDDAVMLQRCFEEFAEDVLKLSRIAKSEIKSTGIGEPQPRPHGTGREIGKLVLADIEKRIEKGIETYGEPLKAHNGRNALVDAYEEALDLAIYLRQVIEENQ